MAEGLKCTLESTDIPYILLTIQGKATTEKLLAFNNDIIAVVGQAPDPVGVIIDATGFVVTPGLLTTARGTALINKKIKVVVIVGPQFIKALAHLIFGLGNKSGRMHTDVVEAATREEALRLISKVR